MAGIFVGYETIDGVTYEKYVTETQKTADQLVKEAEISPERETSIFGSGLLDLLDSMNGRTSFFSDSSKTSDEKLEVLITKRRQNDKEISALEQKIEAEEKRISDAINAAEGISEENKAAANSAYNQVIEAYKNGEISASELKSKISSAINNSINTAELKDLEAVIESATATISQYSSEVRSIKSDNEDINRDIELLSKETEQIAELVAKQAAIEEEQAAASSDPIGFTTADELGNMVQFDFFVDRDGNGTLSDTSEFLGATADKNGKDGWTEMEAYDTDSDGVITYDELQNADVNGGELKVVVTKENADGTKTQEVKSLAEAFGSSNLEISASKNSTIDSNVGPLNFNDNLNNIMLGNFNVTLDGEQVVGYQTSDDVEFLKDNYTFSNDRTTTETNTSRFAEGLTFNEYGGLFFKRNNQLPQTSSAQIDQIENLITELDKYERELV